MINSTSATYMAIYMDRYIANSIKSLFPIYLIICFRHMHVTWYDISVGKILIKIKVEEYSNIIATIYVYTYIYTNATRPNTIDKNTSCYVCV